MVWWKRKPPPPKEPPEEPEDETIAEYVEPTVTEQRRFSWRSVTSRDGKPFWINLDTVTHMVGSFGDTDLTILFMKDSDKFLEVRETPQYLLSEAGEEDSRHLVEITLAEDEQHD